MMRRRSLGRTGLMVSELSLGTAELGLEYGIATTGERLKPDEHHAAKVLREALDLGINLLDTARAYGDAEEIIGRTLKGRRNDFILVSKTSASRAVADSLAALQTDHIHVMLIHCGVDVAPDSATAEELLKLRDAGAIGYVGASVYGEAAALAAIDSGWCDCIEVAMSLLDRRPEERVLARAAEKQVGVLARSVLLKGALTKRVCALPPDFLPLQHAVQQVLRATGTSLEDLPELAYRYVLMQEPPQSALIGSARLSELRACVAYAEKGPLPDDVVAQIRSLGMPEPRWLNPGLWPLF